MFSQLKLSLKTTAREVRMRVEEVRRLTIEEKRRLLMLAVIAALVAALVVSAHQIVRYRAVIDGPTALERHLLSTMIQDIARK